MRKTPPLTIALQMVLTHDVVFTIEEIVERLRVNGWVPPNLAHTINYIRCVLCAKPEMFKHTRVKGQGYRFQSKHLEDKCPTCKPQWMVREVQPLSVAV